MASARAAAVSAGGQGGRGGRGGRTDGSGPASTETSSATIVRKDAVSISQPRLAVYRTESL